MLRRNQVSCETLFWLLVISATADGRFTSQAHPNLSSVAINHHDMSICHHLSPANALEGKAW